MTDDRAVNILRRLIAHGRPVRRTTTGFELDRGEYLCRTSDMSNLRTLGYVQKSDDDHFSPTPSGIAFAQAHRPQNGFGDADTHQEAPKG